MFYGFAWDFQLFSDFLEIISDDDLNRSAVHQLSVDQCVEEILTPPECAACCSGCPFWCDLASFDIFEATTSFSCDHCDNMPLNTPIAHILQSGERNMAAFRHISYRYTTNERDKHSNVEIRCCIFSFLSGLHSFYRIATQKQDDTHFYYARLHE